MEKRKDGFRLQDKATKRKTATSKRLIALGIGLQLATLGLLAWTGSKILERV